MDEPTGALDVVENTILHAAQLVRTADSAAQVARYLHQNAPKVVEFLSKEESNVPTVAYAVVGAGLLGWALLRERVR